MDKLKVVALLSTLVWSCIAGAQSGSSWAIGLGAGANAMTPFLLQQAEQEQQKRLMLQQHNLEMQRIEREHELRMQSIREPEEARRRAAEQQANSFQSESQKVESAHPGWVSTVGSSEFRAWQKQQPESVKQLGNSERANDAILMIDLFERDRRRGSQ